VLGGRLLTFVVRFDDVLLWRRIVGGVWLRRWVLGDEVVRLIVVCRKYPSAGDVDYY